jgi:hypothetical protein
MSFTPGERDCSARRNTGGDGGESGDCDNADSLQYRGRPGRARTRRESQPAGRQPHRRYHAELRNWAKRLQLLHELLPKATEIGVLVNPKKPSVYRDAAQRNANRGRRARNADSCPQRR